MKWSYVQRQRLPGMTFFTTSLLGYHITAVVLEVTEDYDELVFTFCTPKDIEERRFRLEESITQAKRHSDLGHNLYVMSTADLEFERMDNAMDSNLINYMLSFPEACPARLIRYANKSVSDFFASMVKSHAAHLRNRDREFKSRQRRAENAKLRAAAKAEEKNPTGPLELVGNVA